jgi:DNA-binding NarL/FixJ family response regulator
MTTVLLIEYPPAVRQALRARLSLERDLDVVGEADDALQGIALAQALDPDVVLIDAETPDLDAARTVRELAQTNAFAGIVVLSHHTATLAGEVAGIPAVIVGKHAGQAALVAAIRSAARQSRRDS